MNWMLLLGILLILGIGLAIYYNFPEQNLEFEEGVVFQGPVPEGYDEEHFRQTGITKLIEVEN